MYIVRRLLLFKVILLFAVRCVPTPYTEPQTLPVLALYLIQLEEYRNKDCLIAGFSQTVSSSGILICIRNYGDHCRGDLFFESAGARNSLISNINKISLQHPVCATAATNAIQQVNQLALPAQLLLYTSGGTAGPHRSSLNYAERRISSCKAVGMQTATFLGGATSLANESQMDFLAKAAGLVAIQDTVGSCRLSLGLNSWQTATITDLLAGSLTRTAICDFGSDDPREPTARQVFIVRILCSVVLVAGRW